MAVEKLVDIITFAFCIDHSVEVNLICSISSSDEKSIRNSIKTFECTMHCISILLKHLASLKLT